MKNMKTWMTGLAAGALMTMGVAAEDAAPVYTAPQMEKAAVVDGAVGPDEYPAAVMTMKDTPYRYEINGAPAQARAFHDGKTLYVAVTVPIESADNLTKIDYWSQGDGAEVCFRAATDAKETPSFVVHGFVTGVHAAVTHGGVSDVAAEKLQKAVKFSAKVSPTSWTGEWAIPLEAAGIEFKPGLKLDFNLGVWRSESYEWINWRGTEGPTHKLDDGGALILEGKK